MVKILFACFTFAFGMSSISCMCAQWPEVKAPGIPRLPDGTPDLNAPWPKLSSGQSDFSGMWNTISQSGYHMNVISGKRAVMTEAGATLFRQRAAMLGSGFMSVTCMPFGPVAMLNYEGAIRFYQNATSVVFLFGNMTYRVIHTDGRALPRSANPAWMGYSVGHWEGDALVVQSSGFRDETWLDPQGHPHSEQLRLVERLRRRDFGHLEYEVTFTDPVYYREPFTLKGLMENIPDNYEQEYVCHENERDRSHLRSVPLPPTPFVVPAETLAGYAGRYTGKFGSQAFEVRDGQLVFLNGPVNYPFEYPMEPLGLGEFLIAGVGVVKFSLGADGKMSAAMDGVTTVRN